MARNERKIAALTGMPIEKRLLDLLSIFNFLNPGCLGNQTPFMTEQSHKFTCLSEMVQEIIDILFGKRTLGRRFQHLGEY